MPPALQVGPIDIATIDGEDPIVDAIEVARAIYTQSVRVPLDTSLICKARSFLL
jgi:hypothetical protein